MHLETGLPHDEYWSRAPELLEQVEQWSHHSTDPNVLKGHEVFGEAYAD